GSNSIPAIRVPDAMLGEWLARAGEDGILEVTPYQINRILLHALCYPANTWSPLFQQCLPNLLEFIRNRCNQEQNTAGDALARDSWPEALLAQIERIAAPESTGEPSLPVLLTPGTITPASSLDVARLLAASRDMPDAMVRQIVELPGFDPHATNRDELTPFYLAAEYGNTRFAEALLERGTNYEVMYRDFFPSLHLAIRNQHMLFVQWFLQTLPEHERVNAFIAKNQYGDTILHQVASIRPKLLKQILDCLPEAERTGTVMIKNNIGDTVLHLIATGRHEILNQLLDCLPEAARAGAVMIRNDIGNTVLQWVATKHPEILKQIMDCLPETARADAVNIRNGDGFTVLHQLLGCSLEIFKQLMDSLPEAAKTDALMAKDNYGNTVLHHISNQPESLKLLLDCLPETARARAILVKSSDGDTVLDKAKRLEHYQSLHFLQEVLEQAKQRTAIQTCPYSTIPSNDAGSGLSTLASASNLGTSTPLASYSIFSQGSVTPPEPVSPEEQRTLKR
ncbi:ankyrin repeat domain-containing protein, partial [Legionella moravica]|uniref:ankyrin repeat domain-containing protein n=1 Tax=Legionella moravica TaxID=39962 RepID=UPI0005689BC7